jgi:tetratricopeptide (TPR) repeat protein
MVFMNRGEWETAKIHLQNSIRHCEKTSFLQWLALAWSGLGLAEAVLADPEVGRKYVEKGLKILSALQTKPDVSIAYLFLGEIYWSLGLADKAGGFLRKAAEMFEEMGMDYWLDKTHEILEKLMNDAQTRDPAQRMIVPGGYGRLIDVKKGQ